MNIFLLCKKINKHNSIPKNSMINHSMLLFICLNFLYSCNTIKVTKFEASDCKSSCKTGLSEYTKIGNKTIIIYGIFDNCCHEFKGKAKLKNDTLFLITKKLGNPCKCRCTYELTYEIKGLKTDASIIKHVQKSKKYSTKP